MTDYFTSAVRSVVLVSALVAPSSGTAQPVAPGTMERATDKEIRQLLERIDDERARFEDQLDPALKRSILRGPRGEVDVARALDDLEDNVDKLKERFGEDYAAGAEVTAVLRQGGDIQVYMATLPPAYKGASEWNEFAASLTTLANAYGTTFPMGEGHTARRINDRELQVAAEQAEKAIDRFKKELDSSLKKDPTIDEPAREAAVDDVDRLKREARTLASRVDDEKPATGEARQLLDHALRIEAGLAARPLSPTARQAWISLSASLQKIAQAFDVPGPRS